MNSISKKILIISGRDNLGKDDEFNKKLLAEFNADNYDIVFDPRFRIIAQVNLFRNKYKRLPSIVYKTFRLLLDSKYYCKCFGDVLFYAGQYIKKRNYFEFRYMIKCITLIYILKKNRKNEVAVLSRSAGGVIATKIASKFDVKLIICVGYPFKHPDKDDEPFRYVHLKSISTPVLIIQGENDEYGGADIRTKYELSEDVELFFVDATHNFRIGHQQWEKFIIKTKQALAQAFKG